MKVYVLIAEYSDHSGYKVIAAYDEAARGSEDLTLLREHGDGMLYELNEVRRVVATAEKGAPDANV